ncbi:MAG: PopZ family protein [Phyllobacterium sp.]
MAVQQEPVTGKPYIAPDFNRDASETIASPVETTDSAAVDVAPEEKNVPIGKIEAAPKATLSAKTVVSEELPAATDADMADDFPPVSSGIAAADNAPTTEMGSANVNSQSILSQSAEQKVASAFEDLSYAVMEEQRQSFDDMAREILRPMLQDWLDNNLPMLVERLVREEIERVARGGRR